MNEDDMYELARTDIGFEDFLRTVGKQNPRDVMWALAYAKRWSDLNQLVDDPLYGEHALAELRIHAAIVQGHAMDDQRVAKMLDDHPELRMLYETCRQIWWICNIHFPHRSPHVPLPNLLCITGDGMGLAYFMVETLKDGGKLLPVKIVDPELEAVCRHVGIVVDAMTTLTKLEVAMAVFRRKVNARLNALR